MQRGYAGRCSCCWVAVFLQPRRPGLTEPVVIKFATLAPEGTPWMNIMEEMNREVRRRAVVRSPSVSTLAAWLAMSAMSSARSASINCTVVRSAVLAWVRCSPKFAFWNCPCCFAMARKQTTLPTALFEHFAVAFAQKHFVLLALNDAGSVYVFSKDPIRTKADMARSKIWTWQGDPLPQAIFKAYGIVPVPLSLPNVLPSLQSGLIDACYGTP